MAGKTGSAISFLRKLIEGRTPGRDLVDDLANLQRAWEAQFTGEDIRWPILEQAGQERLRREPGILDVAREDPLTGSSSATLGGGEEAFLERVNRGRSPEDKDWVTWDMVMEPGVRISASDEGRRETIQGLSAEGATGIPESLTDVEGIIRVLDDPKSTPEAFQKAHLAKEALIGGKEMPFQKIPKGWKGDELPYMEIAEKQQFPPITDVQRYQALADAADPRFGKDWARAEASGTTSDIHGGGLQGLIDSGNPEVLYRLARHSEEGRARFDMGKTTANLTKRLGLDEGWTPGTEWGDIDPSHQPIASDFVFRKGYNKPGDKQKHYTVDGTEEGVYVYRSEDQTGTPSLLKLDAATYKVADSAFDASDDATRDKVLREFLSGTGEGKDEKVQIRALRENFSPALHIKPVLRNKGGKPIEGYGLTEEQAQIAWDDTTNMVGTFSFSDVEANFVATKIKQYVRWKYGEKGLEEISFDAYDTPMVAHIVNAANNAAAARQQGALIDNPEAWYNFGNTFNTFRAVWGNSPAGLEAGQARFLDFANMVGATTANQKPWANLRSASWYNYVFSSRGTFGGTLRRQEYPVFRSMNPNSTKVDFDDVPDALKAEYQDEYAQVIINTLPNRVEWKTLQEFYGGNFDSGKAYIGRDAELRGPEASAADQAKRAGSVKFYRNSDKVGKEKIQAVAGTYDKFLKKLKENYKEALPDKSDKIIAERVKLFEQKSYINPYWTLPKSIEMGEQPWMATFKESGVHPRQRYGTEVDPTDPRRVELEASQKPQDKAIAAGTKTLESFLGKDYTRTEKATASLLKKVTKIYSADEAAVRKKLKKETNQRTITRLEEKLESYTLKKDDPKNKDLAWPKLETNANSETKANLTTLNRQLKTARGRLSKMDAALGEERELPAKMEMWPDTKGQPWHEKFMATAAALRKAKTERGKNIFIDDPLPAVATDADGVPIHSLTKEAAQQAENIQRIDKNKARSWRTDDLKALEASIRKEGGITYDIVTSTSKSKGYAVAPFKSSEVGIPKADFSDKDIDAYVEKWEEALSIPGAHYGVWFKEETGEFMQDVSIVVEDEITAAAIGRAGKQDSFVRLFDNDGGFKEFKLTGEGEKYGKDTQELIRAERDFVKSDWSGVLREAEDRVLRGVQEQDQTALAKGRYAEDPLAVTEAVEKSAVAPPYGGGQYYQTWQRVMDKPEEQANFYRDLTRAAYRHIKDKDMAALNWPAYFRVDPLEAQKSGHFIGNVAGEALTATLDKVMSNLFLMRGGTGTRLDAPEAGAYVLYDEFLREIAKGYDLLPSEFQAQAWLGSSNKMQHAGVGSSAGRILQERFKITAAILNRLTPVDKKKVTPDMVRILWTKGAFPLLSFGAAAALGIRGDETPFDRDREAL
jgi:hypothetical protein